ncbi:MAG: prepilin-type N-terminal cleavage/methylation domain-containing protein [Gammaproteobacteria bacterium]|nr:MAG: prepilin-type N-terminal cleavage/methylation domain-containing protein [Gammaproteobacteria bacterium]
MPNLRQIKNQAGFTLIEAMITIVVLAILMATAIPALDDFFDRKRLIKAAEAVAADLQLARSEAIARSDNVFVNFSRTDDTTWAFGVGLITNCDLTDTTPVAGSCSLVISDGDASLDPGDGSVDTGDLVLRRRSSADFPGARLISVGFPTVAASAETEFDYVRGTANNGTVTLRSNDGYEIQVRVSLIGRVRLCSPAGDTHVSGYATCT